MPAPVRGPLDNPKWYASRWYLGIDPGVSGGAVLISTGGTYASLRFKTKDEPTPYPLIWGWLTSALDVANTCGTGQLKVTIEKVGGYMGNTKGGKEQHADGESNRASAHTMFNFGYHAGILEGFLIGLGLIEGDGYEKVQPKVWQKALRISRSATETTTQWKARLRETAKLFFPSEGIVQSIGDATLLALYAAKKYEGADYAPSAA